MEISSVHINESRLNTGNTCHKMKRELHQRPRGTIWNLCVSSKCIFRTSSWVNSRYITENACVYACVTMENYWKTKTAFDSKQVTNLLTVSTHITEVRLFENKEHILAPAAFLSTSALKQLVSGFHRTQTCVLKTRTAFSMCYENPPFKNTQLTQANMAGIMATCGYNWASRAPGGWASIY